MIHPVLFGAVPIARGQGEVESLSAFFARLCLARFLYATPVYRTYIIERCPVGLFPDHPLRIGNFLGQHSARLDLQPKSAVSFAAALEALTGLSDLPALTFSAVAPMLDSASLRHLGRFRKRWCPACLAAWEREDAPVYEPLLWRFALVERCSVHRMRLLDRCPNCERFQPLITQGVPIGYCVRCGHALHHGASLFSPDEASLDVSDRWALWRSVAVSRLLAWSSSLDANALARPAVSKHGFRRLLEHRLESLTKPVTRSRLAFACALGIDPSRFYRLLSGALQPTLRVLLDTSMQLGVDPVRVVCDEFHEGEQSWPPTEGSELSPCPDPWGFALVVRESSMARRYPDRARALDEFIADPTAVDLAGLMRTHSTGPASLSTSFPLRHLRACELRVQRLERERANLKQRLNSALEGEIASGAPRPLSEVAESVGVPRAALKYHSAERSAECVALRESSFSTRERGLRERVQAVLLAALEVTEGPTVHEVARSLGIEDFVVLSLCPDDYRRLVEVRGREREARHGSYADAMREDLRCPRPHGVTAVADALGVCHATLKRADPRLYSKLAAVPLERADTKRRRRESEAHVRAERLSERRLQLRAALKRELQSDSPRSPRAVALENGVSASVLRHHCRKLYDRLLELREARDSEFLESVRNALEAEVGVPSPRSVSRFAREHGIDLQALKASFPSLVAELRDAYRRAPPRRLPRRPRPGDARLLAALESEAKSESPRSLRALARSLGVSPCTLSRVSRPAVERLLASGRRAGFWRGREITP